MIPLSPDYVSNRLSSYLNHSLIVAFSGGVDSTVLLHLLVQLRDSGLVNTLKAVYVHHGLHKEADAWATHCQSLCDMWGVPLVIETVVVKSAGKGIEQAARDARYAVFERMVIAGGCILLGHHRNDQAETFLFRLFRGTGLDGLQGMPSIRRLGEGILLRPLISASKGAIEIYARQNQLPFVEDGSNYDERFTRNFLRCKLIPEVDRCWPGVSDRLVELAGEIERVNSYLSSQVDVLLNNALVYRPDLMLGQQPALVISRLVQMDDMMQKQVVRHWLKGQGWAVPNRQSLDLIFDQIVAAREDRVPCFHIGGYSVRRFKGHLVATGKVSVDPFEPFLWDCQTKPLIQLSDKHLRRVPAVEGDKGVVRISVGSLMVMRRAHVEAEKIALAGRSGRKTLKKWLQEYNVPPWLRDFWPLLYDGGRMVAVPGLWVCEGYQSEDGKGYLFYWD